MRRVLKDGVGFDSIDLVFKPSSKNITYYANIYTPNNFEGLRAMEIQELLKGMLADMKNVRKLADVSLEIQKVISDEQDRISRETPENTDEYGALIDIKERFQYINQLISTIDMEIMTIASDILETIPEDMEEEEPEEEEAEEEVEEEEETEEETDTDSDEAVAELEAALAQEEVEESRKYGSDKVLNEDFIVDLMDFEYAVKQLPSKFKSAYIDVIDHIKHVLFKSKDNKAIGWKMTQSYDNPYSFTGRVDKEVYLRRTDKLFSAVQAWRAASRLFNSPEAKLDFIIDVEPIYEDSKDIPWNIYRGKPVEEYKSYKESIEKTKEKLLLEKTISKHIKQCVSEINPTKMSDKEIESAIQGYYDDNEVGGNFSKFKKSVQAELKNKKESISRFKIRRIVEAKVGESKKPVQEGIIKDTALTLLYRLGILGKKLTPENNPEVYEAAVKALENWVGNSTYKKAWDKYTEASGGPAPSDRWDDRFPSLGDKTIKILGLEDLDGDVRIRLSSKYTRFAEQIWKQRIKEEKNQSKDALKQKSEETGIAYESKKPVQEGKDLTKHIKQCADSINPDKMSIAEMSDIIQGYYDDNEVGGSYSKFRKEVLNSLKGKK